MADNDHLARLRRGVAAWNRWRRDKPFVRPYLRDADLRGCCLKGVDLTGADLRRADLAGADCMGALLYGAELRGARYAIPQMLLANWGIVSDDLCVQLMMLDCDALPDGERLFRWWARTGECPYDGREYMRVAFFRERRDLWRPLEASERWPLAQIWAQLAREKGITIDG